MNKLYLRNSRAYAILSDEDVQWARQWDWSLSSNGYAVRYVEDDGRYKTIYLHREVMQRKLGKPIPPGLQVDHVGRQRLLNTREALRLATRSQNQANKGIQVNNSSQFKGINYNQGKFEARIRYRGKRLHLGRFDDPERAALYYDCASRLLYLAFSGTNFPEVPTPSDVETAVRDRLVRYGIDI
jgi:hypothetical protein